MPTYQACFTCGRSFLKSELRAGKNRTGPQCVSCTPDAKTPLMTPIRPGPKMAGDDTAMRYRVFTYRSGRPTEKADYDQLDSAMDTARRSGNAKVVHIESKEVMGEWRDHQQVR